METSFCQPSLIIRALKWKGMEKVLRVRTRTMEGVTPGMESPRILGADSILKPARKSLDLLWDMTPLESFKVFKNMKDFL